jgi:TP901 family phage tail tape measure protein
MAEETISTRIVANADFSALIADVHKVTASLSKLQEQLANSNRMLSNQIAVMNRSFSDTLRSTGQFSTHFVSLQSDVEKFGKNLDGGKLKLNQYFNAFRENAKTSGGIIRDLAKQQVALQNAILQPLGRNAQGLMQFNVHVPRGLDEVKNKTAIARQELQIYNKVIQDGAVQLINWGKNTQWAGRQLTVGLTLPLAAFGKAAADAFRMADQELVRLTKVYGDVAGTSATELTRVRKEVSATAKELSSAMGVNFRETIGLAADIAATGKTGNELLSSISETTRLAVLGEVDRQEAMKATLAIQSAFKSNTEELADSINFLNAVENQTSTTLNDLVEAIPKAGPVIKGLGGNVQDLALYLTAMREGGINASEGANALKSALASLINPTDVAVAKFEGFGIDLLGLVQKNAGNVTGTLFALQAALDTLDPLKKQQALEQLFGKFQFARLNALFENLGRQGSQTLQVLDLMKASSAELGAVADRELKAVTESASGRYKRAIEGLRADLAGVGEQFLSISTTIINVVDKVIDFVNSLPGPIKQALTFLGGLTAIAGPLIMMTGVLANFFGYILKGVAHMKAFFKGGEGWKYLTPEMLAAEKAGKLVEQTFYSDAKAASVLQMALKGLIDEFTILQGKASQSVVGVGPAVSTIAGNVVGGTVPRIVDPSNPFVGQPYSRASTHMVPRSSMTDQQKMQQTLFGFVPGSIPVNRRIGNNPQIYMNEPLPNVPGLTQVGGVSTGVVAPEAARWHSMMATLAMQSKEEIDQLRQQIIATGTVSRDFMSTFDDILPAVSALTDNAATQSASIVAELRAGKLTVDQAKQQIIALNLETERMIGAAVTQQAAAMGKTINLTQVPTLSQPVVDATGKSNMRELFKKSRSKMFIDRVARALGVRTSGAGYNIETTKPQKFNLGGVARTLAGKLVPGPNVNKDVVPAMLTPGEFVINKEATRKHLPLLRAINASRGQVPIAQRLKGITGGEQYKVKALMDEAGVPVNMLQNSVYPMLHATNLSSRGGVGIPGVAFVRDFRNPGVFNMANEILRRNGLPRINQSQHGLINKYLDDNVAGVASLTEAEFGNHLTRAYLSAGVSKDQLVALSAENTMRFAFPGEGSIMERRSMLMNQLRTRFGTDGIRVKPDKNPNNIIVSFPGQPPFKIRHEATRGLSKLTGGVTYESIRQGLPAGISGGQKLSYAHAPLDTTLFMNSGGMVPGVQYYENGGEVSPFRAGFQSVAGTKGNRQYFGSGLFKPDNTGMRGMAAGMGLGMAGSLVGGQAGQIMQMASILPMLAPNLLTKTFNGLKGITSGLSDTGKMAGFAGKALGLAFRAGPLLGVTAALTGVALAVRYVRQEAEKRRKEEVASIGITKKMSEEAKLRNLNLSDSIKKVTDSLKLQRAAGLAAYEAYTQSGIPQLTLTIKELKAAQKEAKETMKESISIFDNADPSEVIDLAKNLKAEYIAGGMSVQEATNKIYALISVSNKANQALSVVANSGFVAISDEATAADFKIKAVVASLNTVDGEALASGIDSMVTLLDMSIDKLTTTKDEFGNVMDAGEALEAQFNKIAAAGGSSPIGENAYQNLIKVRPELEGIITSADTLETIYAKWQIATSGVVVNLEKLTAAQARSLALAQAAARDAISNMKETGAEGVLGASQKALDKLNKTVGRNSADSQAAYEKSQKNAEKELDLIDKKIKKINEEAEARKKALEDRQRSEDLNLEIQKAQLEYQNKVSAGDMAGAAQAQLRIKQLVGEREVQKAIESIEENRAKRVKAEEAKADKIRAAAKRRDEANASIVANASRAAEQRGIIQDLQAKYEDLLVRQNNLEFIKDPTSKDREAKSITGGINQLSRDIAAAGKGNSQFSKILADAFPGLVALSGGVLTAQDKTRVYQTSPSLVGGTPIVGTGITTSAAQIAFNAEAEKLKIAQAAQFAALGGGATLQDVVDAILGKEGTGELGSKTNPFKVISGPKTKQYELNERGTLTTEGGRQLIADKGYQANKYFEYKGKTYRVHSKYSGGGGTTLESRWTGRATFGRVVPGRQYLVGERGPEWFNTDLPGNIGPYYNVPKGPSNAIYQAGSTNISGGSNNQVFNFHFEEAPKNARELFTEFKKLVKTEMSKSGESIVYGGRY